MCSFSFFAGYNLAPSLQVAVRERIHIHYLVQIGPAQRSQHREGKAIPLLVSQATFALTYGMVVYTSANNVSL